MPIIAQPSRNRVSAAPTRTTDPGKTGGLVGSKEAQALLKALSQDELQALAVSASSFASRGAGGPSGPGTQAATDISQGFDTARAVAELEFLKSDLDRQLQLEALATQERLATPQVVTSPGGFGTEQALLEFEREKLASGEAQAQLQRDFLLEQQGLTQTLGLESMLFQLLLQTLTQGGDFDADDIQDLIAELTGGTSPTAERRPTPIFLS